MYYLTKSLFKVSEVFLKRRHFRNPAFYCLSTMDLSLSPGELERYFDHIGLPYKFQVQQKPPLDITLLTALHTHHISTIPYENLSLHYTKDVNISLDVHVLLEKFLANGRGGYCMEHSIFFNSVLRAYGFQVYLTGARPRLRKNGVPYGEYQGWYVLAHSILFPLLSSVGDFYL